MTAVVLHKLSSQAGVNNSFYCSIVMKSFVLCSFMAFNLTCAYCVFPGCGALCYGSNSREVANLVGKSAPG